jgi:ABC-type Na+ transport system ATPase subunit NatA
VHGFDVFDDPLRGPEAHRLLAAARAPLYQDMSVMEYLQFVADMRGPDQSTFKKRMRDRRRLRSGPGARQEHRRPLTRRYRVSVGLGQALRA